MNLDSRFAGVTDLGSLVSHHPVSNHNRWTGLILGLACLAAAGGLFSLAVSTYLDLSSPYAPNVILPVLFALGALLVGLWMLFDTVRHWNTAAAVYEHGLALTDYTGLRQIRWEAVDSVWQSVTKHYRNGSYTHTTYVYTVQTNTGQKLRFDSKLAQIEALGQTLQRQISAILLPRYAQALNSGQRLNFGPLALDREGLYVGNKSLPWPEIEAIKIQNGAIAIKKAAGGRLHQAPVSLAQVPNFWVFYEIVSHLTKME